MVKTCGSIVLPKNGRESTKVCIYFKDRLLINRFKALPQNNLKKKALRDQWEIEETRKSVILKLCI
eukprot:snap_masked-scaffold_42-processed-gene-2.42-mRNA-1 protein AED:1.00 eAED:1.00 QI:0/-1/0/0/-1/1/1/0/65